MRSTKAPATLALFFAVSLASCNMPSSVPVDTTSAAATVNAHAGLTLTALAGGSMPVTNPIIVGPQITNTPEGLWLTVSQETNCRSGPGTAYDRVGGIETGERAEVAGRTADSQNWYIRNPDLPASFCWVWGRYATLSGDTALAYIMTPPPLPTATLSPTPSADFQVSYVLMATCTGSFAPQFYIRNTGSIMFESIQITVTDTITAISKVHTADQFAEFDACPMVMAQQDLTPGESGNVTTHTSPFAYDPTGHAMTAAIKLCSQNGLAGTCMTRSLNFTP